MVGYIRKKIKNITLKQSTLILIMLTVIIIVIKRIMNFNFRLGGDRLRECDAMGCGYYGANRGARKHKGIDLLFSKYESVYVPFKLKIIRFGKPYSTTSKFDLVEFKGFGFLSLFKFKVMYIDTVKTWSVGDILEKNELLGNAQPIAEYHGNGMQNHIHFEAYFMGKLINPTKLIKFIK